jgi:RNA polymerase sigma-70 factor (ECF subfamily)
MTTHADEVSVEQAYVRYRTEIYRFLLRRTRDHHEAEDLTQEAFADAAATLSRSTAPTSMRGWLFAVAERRAVDEHRRRKRAARVVGTLLDLPDAAGDDEAADVEAALRKLPQAQRRIVVLRIVEGRTYGDIARALGCNEAACRMRLSRALRRLRNELRATS